jgi:uncharacterized protein (DUF736 family)
MPAGGTIKLPQDDLLARVIAGRGSAVAVDRPETPRRRGDRDVLLACAPRRCGSSAPTQVRSSAVSEAWLLADALRAFGKDGACGAVEGGEHAFRAIASAFTVRFATLASSLSPWVPREPLPSFVAFSGLARLIPSTPLGGSPALRASDVGVRPLLRAPSGNGPRETEGEIDMATIANLTVKADGALEGTLTTLNVTAAITIVPNARKASANSPDFRVISKKNGFELGACWNRTSKSTGEEYVSVTLSAPEFGTIYGNIAPAPGDDPTKKVIIWNSAD